MSDNVYLVYKTDNQHSYASRDIIGVASFTENAIDICQEKAVKEGEFISNEQLANLVNMKQTQGYSGEGEFQFESVNLDKLL